MFAITEDEEKKSYGNEDGNVLDNEKKNLLESIGNDWPENKDLLLGDYENKDDKGLLDNTGNNLLGNKRNKDENEEDNEKKITGLLL